MKVKNPLRRTLPPLLVIFCPPCLLFPPPVQREEGCKCEETSQLRNAETAQRNTMHWAPGSGGKSLYLPETEFHKLLRWKIEQQKNLLLIGVGQKARSGVERGHLKTKIIVSIFQWSTHSNCVIIKSHPSTHAADTMTHRSLTQNDRSVMFVSKLLVIMQFVVYNCVSVFKPTSTINRDGTVREALRMS